MASFTKVGVTTPLGSFVTHFAVVPRTGEYIEIEKGSLAGTWLVGRVIHTPYEDGMEFDEVFIEIRISKVSG